MAEINIELGWLARVDKLGPVMDKITVQQDMYLLPGLHLEAKQANKSKSVRV